MSGAPRTRWRKRLDELSVVVVLVLLVCLLLPLQRAWAPGSGALAWLLDLGTHWQPYFAGAWVLTCVTGAMRRLRWLWALPLALLPLFTASRKAEHAVGPANLIVAAANVKDDNYDPSDLLAWLRRRPVNLLVLTELTPAFAQELHRRDYGNFRYRALHPLISPPGIGVVSDRPLHNVRILSDNLGALRLEADIVVARERVHFVAIHPKPPNAIRKHAARDRLLRTLAASSRIPTIVAGDVNATPWSSAFLGPHSDQLARATRMAPTWPTPLRGLVGVAIDHVLVSPHFAVVEADRGPHIGSDHYPVRAALLLRVASVHRISERSP